MKPCPAYVMEEHMDALNAHAERIIEEYRDHVEDIGYRQRWDIVPAARLARIWEDYMNLKWVRDERGMDLIADIVLDNILKIQVNTILCGHTETDPRSFAESIRGDEFPEGYFEKNETFFDDDRGQWRISDFAMRALIDAALDLRMAAKFEQRLQIVDYILSLVHPRSDLASWFVEGGIRTLTNLRYKAA